MLAIQSQIPERVADIVVVDHLDSASLLDGADLGIPVHDQVHVLRDPFERFGCHHDLSLSTDRLNVN